MYVFRKKINIILVGLVDLIGYILFLPFFIFKRNINLEKLRKILIIRVDSIGDIILSLPVFETIKKNFENVELHFLTQSAVKEIIVKNIYIDKVFFYDAPWFSNKRFSLREFFNLVSKLRREKYKIGICLRGDFRNIILLFLLGIPYRISYGITGGGFLLTHKVKYEKNLHQIDKNLKLLEPLKIKNYYYEIHLSEDKDKKILVENFLEENKINNEFLVGIHPSASYPSKRWSIEKFAELISKISNEHNVQILLFGKGKEDEIISQKIKEISNVNFINLVNKTDIGETLSFIKRCNIFIGCDSSLSHLAAYSNIPTIIIYSGTSEVEYWKPRVENVKILYKRLSCYNCQKKICEKNNECLELIEVDEVYDIFKGWMIKLYKSENYK